MFNIKQFVNRITDNRNERDGSGETSAAFVDNEEQHSAEGFLCPPCMKAFPSPEALEEHYKRTHENDVTSDSNSNSNGDSPLLRQEIQLLQDSLAMEKANSEELKSEILKMQADLNAKDFDATSLRSQEKELEDSKIFLTSEVTLLRQQLADSLAQIVTLRKENETATGKAKSSSDEKEELKKEVTSLLAQLSHRNSVDDSELLRQELVSIQKVMDQLALEKEKEIETLNNKLNEMQPNSNNDKLQEQLNQTLSELQVLKTNYEENKQQNSEILKKYSDEISQKDTKISNLKDDVNTENKKAEVLNTQCQQLTEECQRLRDQLADVCSKIETGEGAKAALKGLQDENTIMKNNLEEAQVQNRELSRRNHDLGAQLGKSIAENKVVQAELDNTKKEYNLLQTKMDETLITKKTELEELFTKNQRYEIQVQRNESELKNLNGEKLRLEKEMSTKGALCDKLKTQVEESKKVVSDQAAKIVQLEETITNNASSLATVQKNLDLTKAEYQSAQAKLIAVETDLSNKTNELQQAVENYESQLTSTELQLSEKTARLEEMNNENLALNKSMTEQTSALKTQLEALKSELDEKDSDLDKKIIAIKELSEECNLKAKNFQLLQSKVDELIEQKLQLEQTCESNEQEKSQLLEKLISYESETKGLNTTIEELSRKRDDAMAALQELGRENQSLQIEIAKIQGRKWADDSNVSNCSSCSKEFTLTFRKHHCRHCGQIFCNDCSSKSASVPSSKKPVRVCENCYVKLTTQ